MWGAEIVHYSFKKQKNLSSGNFYRSGDNSIDTI
jgi:hypothetical protein